jgi:uncharacterized membrane protein
MSNKSSKQPSIGFLNKLKLKATNYLGSLNYLGLLFAVSFFAFSVSPSLLPRTALIQGVVSGLSIVAGYGIGVAISHLIRWSTESDVPKKFKRPAWLFLYIGGAVTILIFAWLGKLWHDEVRSLVGLDPDHGLRIFTVLLITLLVAMFILAISRGIRKLFRFILVKIDQFLPRRISHGLSFVIVSLFIFWIASGVFASNFLAFANSYFGARDTTVPDGYSQPVDSLRSGSAESLSSWDKIGYQGRKFVAGGPNKTDITNVMGGQANDPIRVYVGLKQAETAEQRAEIAVKELERTGAFKRSVLILATTTGSGWLEPSAVDSIEYIYGGNTAIVSQQYSYLPSWISYLADKETATDAGQALFDAVYGKWSQIPKESRPKLYAYGLSLGSFGGQTPYSGVNDLRFSIDGAVFVGTPNFTRLWRNVTDNRDNGSPEWLPVYQGGKAVRFANNNESITADQTNWKSPRILYVQHASDPVVWFDFSLIDTKPDWLNEKRGPDVSPATRWFPVVTFLQLGIDQASAGNVPVGYGHMYGSAVVNSWVSVTNPPNWTTEKTTKLQNYINENY